MKNVLKSLSFLMVLGTLFFISSCGSDDGGGIIIDDDDGGSFTVADGLYIAGISGSDTTVITGNKLNSVNVEDEGFGTKARSGHFAAFTYLEAGSYLFVEVEDQEATNGFGGATSEYNDDSAENTDDYTGGYTVVDLSGSTSTFSVATSGFYHVIFDTQSDEALLVGISSWGAIGGAVYSDACTSDGFNADIDLAEVSASAADGAVYEGEGIILKDGEFKVRYNDSWKIDRRTDKSSYDDANGYVVLTNLGGTPAALEEGGANISLSENSIDNGTYNIQFSIDETGTAEIGLTKTGDAPTCAFDPDNYGWGVIGSATGGVAGDGTSVCNEPAGTSTNGWDTEKDLVYRGQNGTEHKWVGLFPLREGEMKIRTDCSWATKLTPGTDTAPVTITNETAEITNNGPENGDGKWIVSASGVGFYYIVITTNDNGANWTLSIDEAVVGVVGAGSPAASWDGANAEAMTFNDDFTADAGSSASLDYSGSWAGGEWKVLVNGSFDYNLGGTADGSTSLLFDSNAFDTAAGEYSLTLTTDDGGVTYTATLE